MKTMKKNNAEIKWGGSCILFEKEEGTAFPPAKILGGDFELAELVLTANICGMSTSCGPGFRGSTKQSFIFWDMYVLICTHHTYIFTNEMQKKKGGGEEVTESMTCHAIACAMSCHSMPCPPKPDTQLAWYPPPLF